MGNNNEKDEKKKWWSACGHLVFTLILLVLPLLLKALFHLNSYFVQNSTEKIDLIADISSGFFAMCAVSLLAPIIYTIERMIVYARITQPAAKTKLNIKIAWADLIAAAVLWAVFFVSDLFGYPFSPCLVGLFSFIVFLIAIIIAFQEKLYDLETEQITTLPILKSSDKLKQDLQSQMEKSDDTNADNTHKHKENQILNLMKMKMRGMMNDGRKKHFYSCN